MPLPDRITATLLLARPAVADAPGLRVHLNEVLGPSGMYFDQFPARHGTTLSARGLTLELRERDLPMPRARLDRALASGLPDMLHEDWAGLVARHRAAISMELRRVPITERRTRGLDADGNEAPPPNEREAVDLMLMAGHIAASWIAQSTRPLAVHWGQSDRIFPAARFRAMEGMLFPLPLYLHPYPVGEQPEDRQILPELEFVGAPQLIGHRLRTAPARVRFDWMMKRVLAFVAHARANDSILAEGSVFGLEDGESISVRRTPDGGVGLVLEERNNMPVARGGERYFHHVA
ncbi:hypothetical protein [Tropicimonas marinistellae]|uniref:hypothetical protein n=1 Tax=Tropicimonas marinistellae TaxID=1739787 RepID=UPI00122DED19|nr:hypothetical protein [Tropicimonas marinistellae]